MFVRRGKFPQVRGKAAEVRHFAAALPALWRTHMNNAIQLHRGIDLMLLRYNVQCEDIMSTVLVVPIALPIALEKSMAVAIAVLLLR